MLVFRDYRLLGPWEHRRLLALRNTPRVRAASSHTGRILLKEHCRWVRSLPETARYMAIFYKGKLIGGAHFVEESPYNRWGFFFAQDTPPLVVPMATVCWIEHLFGLGYERLHSLVRRENIEAQRLNGFLGARVWKKEAKFDRLVIEKEDWAGHREKLGSILARMEKSPCRYEEKG